MKTEVAGSPASKTWLGRPDPDQPLLDAVPLLTVYLLLVTFIPALWVVPGMGAAGRPASLFAVGLFALWALIQVLPNVHTRPTPFRWILFINAIVVMLSYAFAQDRGLPSHESLAADRAVIKLIALNGLILMASEGIPTYDHLQRLTKRITYIVGAVACVGLIQFLVKFDPYSALRFPPLVLNSEVSAELGTRGTNSFVRVKGSTLHPIEFSVLMALGLPLAVHHSLHEPDKRLRRRRSAVTILIAVAAMLAVSRTAVVGLASACLILLWAWSPRLRIRAVGATLVFLVALRAVIPGLLGTIRSLFSNWGNDPSVSGRTADYANVGKFISGRPWFGRGNGTFLPDDYILLDNAYLLRLVSTGFIGLSTLILMLLTGFFMARHCVRRSPSNRIRHLAVAAMAMIFVAIIGAGTYDFFFFPTASGLFYIALGVGAGLGTYHDQIDPDPMPAPPDTLRAGYEVGYESKPWWHRFDPDAT